MVRRDDIVPREELAKIIARDTALRESLLCWAMGHTRHLQNAEDLRGDTLRRALDPEYAGWDRTQHETVSGYLGSVMNGLARNRWRSSYMALREDLDEQNPPRVAAPTGDPEGKLLMAGRERKREDMEAMLRARVAHKPVAVAVLDWAAKGIKGNVALAEQIRCTVPQVVAAKQLLREHAAVVKAERASEPGAA